MLRCFFFFSPSPFQSVRPTLCLRVSLRCRSVSTVERREMFWFYFQSTRFASLLWRNNGGVLLRGFSPRRAMRVLVALTVYSGHKVLQGTAVQGESSRSLALLVLLHGLQHHLLLKEGKPPSLKRKSLRLSVACARPAKSCVAAHVGSRPAEHKHATTCVHVLGQSRHILLMVI